MKYPVKKSILDELGRPLTETSQESTYDLTFALLVGRGLINEPNDTSAEEKIERYDLYKKLRSATNDTDFSVAEVTLMRKAVLLAFKSLIAGQLAEILDQKA
jgi:hypothetical protein